jgi:hypothetical protein
MCVRLGGRRTGERGAAPAAGGPAEREGGIRGYHIVTVGSSILM